MGKDKKLTVQVKLEGSETVTFEGGVEEVSTAFLKFLSKTYPSFELIKKLTLTVDLEELLKSVEGIFAIPEGNGPIIMMVKGKIPDKDAVLLHLTRQYLAGKVGRSLDSSLSLEELSSLIGKSSKTISARLAELMGDWYVEKIERGRYRILVTGINYVVSNIIPELKKEKRK